MQLTHIEAAFKTLKSELGIRPLYHQLGPRVEGHILIAFLAYCLWVTLKKRLQALAPGLTPQAVLEKLATLQMLDVWLPTTDGRNLVMPRYTQPEPDQSILLHHLNLSLPSQPPPRIKAQSNEYPKKPSGCSADLFDALIEKQRLTTIAEPYCESRARLCCASRYPTRFKTEVSTTSPASVKSNAPAIRAACASLKANRKRQKTTAAESSSTKLSPPKARRAGLWELQAVPRESAASSVIHKIVNT